jgi:hypothetical protein
MSDLNVLINSQYLFLRSAQTNSYDSVFEFDTDVMTAMPEHQMSLTVVDFTMQIQYYVVNSLNNQLTFTDVLASSSPSTTITVPPGNYSYKDLCLAVSRLYTGLTCTYDNHTNQAVFTFTTPHTISFINNSYQTFGFNSTDIPSGTTIPSTNQLDLKGGVNQLVLHAAGVSTTACCNVDNFSSDQDLKCKPSDVLAVILDTAPFTVLHWQNPGNQFEMFLNERNISRLQILIKDIYGNDLTYLNPYTITFRARIYKKNVQDGQN